MNRFVIRNRDIKIVKAKDFDNAAFKRGEFDIVMCSPESVRKTLRFLSEQGYMWGCSKTSLLKDTRMKERLLEIIGNEPVYITIDDDVPNGVLLSSAYLLYTNGAVEIDFEEDNAKKIKRIKPKDFDWDGFQQGKVCIVSDSSQNLLAVLLALSEKGYYWGISGKSLIEDSVTTDQLLDDIKQESIYIRAGGDLEHGVICDYTDRRYAVMIDFNEGDNMNMTEIKRVKVEDFDSKAFKRKEFRIAICSPKSMPRILKFLHEKGFKWGRSKTSLLEDAHMREQLLRSTQYNPVFIIAGGDIRNGVVRDIMSSSCIPAVELIFEETHNDKIVITNDGKTTTATLYSNGKKAGIGTAVCHDDDEFDIYTGAKLALNRLEKCKKEAEMSDWKKFVKGKVNMRVPKKYIKNFLDRAEKDGVTFQGTMLDWYLRWLEKDGDSIMICVNSKIEKIPVLVEVIRDDNGETVDYFPGMK